MEIDGYAAVIAGAETVEDARDRLDAAGHEATVQDGSLIMDNGQWTVSSYEGTNRIGDRFYLWCIHDQDGELSRCVARGPKGSCPPRH